MFTKNPHGINPHAKRDATETAQLRFASDEARDTFCSVFGQVLGIEKVRHLGDDVYEIRTHIPIPKIIRTHYRPEPSPAAASY